jgi:hypothetical protein
MIRRGLTGITAAAAIQSLTAGLAQASVTGSALLAQVTVKQAGARNWIVESIVVVVLIGIALFVICKSSRRV